MSDIRSFDAINWHQVVPGFEIYEISKNEARSIVLVRMQKKHLPRYPLRLEEWSALSTNMTTTILLGAGFYQERGKDPVKCSFGDSVNIPARTEYCWMLETPQLIQLATNDPPFDDKDRKV